MKRTTFPLLAKLVMALCLDKLKISKSKFAKCLIQLACSKAGK